MSHNGTLRAMSRSHLMNEVKRSQAELTRREARITQLDNWLRQVLEMLDASSFGGHGTYRCLTPEESKRLREIRLLNGLKA